MLGLILRNIDICDVVNQDISFDTTIYADINNPHASDANCGRTKTILILQKHVSASMLWMFTKSERVYETISGANTKAL